MAVGGQWVNSRFFRLITILTIITSLASAAIAQNQCVGIYSASKIESRSQFSNGDHRQDIQKLLEQYTFPSRYNVDKKDKILRESLYRAFKQKCLYTCMEIERSQASVDHILPESQGGPNNIYNYVLSETIMNSTKSDKFDEIAAIGLLSIVRMHFAPLVIGEYQDIMSEIFDIHNSKHVFSDYNFKDNTVDPTKIQAHGRYLVAEQPSLQKLLFTYRILYQSKSNMISVRRLTKENSDIRTGFTQFRLSFEKPTQAQLDLIQKFISDVQNIKIPVLVDGQPAEPMAAVAAADLQVDGERSVLSLTVADELMRWSSGLTDAEALSLLETALLEVKN